MLDTYRAEYLYCQICCLKVPPCSKMSALQILGLMALVLFHNYFFFSPVVVPINNFSEINRNFYFGRVIQ